VGIILFLTLGLSRDFSTSLLCTDLDYPLAASTLVVVMMLDGI
jgi:hypothetical protein